MASESWRRPQRFPLRGALAGLPVSPATFTALFGALSDDPRFALLAVVIALPPLVLYLGRQWWLAGDSINLRTGFINVTRRSASMDRIQQVDIRQGVFERMLGVSRVVVETASASADADLELTLPAEEAERLRDHLMRRRAGEPPTTDEDAGPVETDLDVITIPTSELALAGISGAELWAGLAAAGALVQRMLDLVPGLDEGDDVASEVEGVALVTVAAIVVTYLSVVSMLGGITVSVVAFGSYTLDTTGARIRVRRGLLARHDESTPVDRVQVVSVEQTFLRRWLRRASMRVRSAGTGDDASGDRLRVPLWPVGDVSALADRLVPGMGSALDAPLRPAPPAARRRALLRSGAAGATVMVLSAGGLALVRPVLVPLTPVVLAAALLLGRAAWRSLGLGLTPGHVTGRAGVVTRRTQVVPREKVQSVRVRSSPFQRRRGLANLHVDVASTASVAIVDRTLDEAIDVAAELVA